MGMRQNKSGREQSKYKGALFDYQHVHWELLYVLLRIDPRHEPGQSDFYECYSLLVLQDRNDQLMVTLPNG